MVKTLHPTPSTAPQSAWKGFLAFLAAAALLAVLAAPGFGLLLVLVLGTGFLLVALLRRIWRLFGPDLGQVSRALQRSVSEGPVTGGLIPLMASTCLTVLILYTAIGL